LWVYNQTHFVWMAGDAETPNLPDIFVSPRGILDSGNYPGSRAYGASFMDNQGLMNMFGRMSNDNVLWKIGFGHECFGKSICRNSINEVCSGHGKCINWNQCACDEGYSGAECQFVGPLTCFGKE